MLFASASSSAAHSEQSERHRDESPVSATAQPEPTDPKEVERFLDSFVPGQMEQHHVPGAAFVLVRDGEVLFSKGYGYADLEHKTLMSPDKTIPRVWSVSKTFAFVVLMRHHEQESFGLDDVYEYLNDVRVDETYPEPVTFEHLLTHTDGFEDRTVGIGTRVDVEPTLPDGWRPSEVPPSAP
jgi:CubicO group peptidase (beta-lactamase class C family)